MPVLLFSVGGVLLIVGIFILIARSQNNSTGSSAGAAHAVPSASVLNAVEHPNPAIFTQVGAGTSSTNLFVALPNKSGTGLPAQNGKPVLLYVGAEYCPFCAADRWSLIMALSRFGSFSGIESNASMTSDIYPGTPTFTFVKATYTSPYLVFDSKEIAGATQTTPLQSLTGAETTIFSTYDVPPYDSLQGGIPFIDFGGLYMTSGGSYDVGVLHVNQGDQNSQALSYAQIVNGLSNARSPIAEAIVGTANDYTAAICKVTNNSDKAVCSTSTILQIESRLPSK
jgi:thiol-disulfide isomerase/thioredoxin